MGSGRGKQPANWRAVYLDNLDMVMLSGNFRAVFESEYHCAILVDRHLVDYSKPQFFVKLGYGKRVYIISLKKDGVEAVFYYYPVTDKYEYDSLRIESLRAALTEAMGDNSMTCQ